MTFCHDARKQICMNTMIYDEYMMNTMACIENNIFDSGHKKLNKLLPVWQGHITMKLLHTTI